MKRERILWMTNVPSPYRVPTWEDLSAHDDLLVAFYGSTQRNRPAWRVPAGAQFDTAPFRTYLARTESDTFLTGLPSRRGFKSLLDWRPSVVIMTGWGDTASVSLGVQLRLRRVRPLLIAYYGTSRSTRSQNRLVAAARRRYFRGFDGFVTYGTESSQLLEADGVDPALIVTGFNSVDVQRLHDDAVKLRRAQPDSEVHRFLFVGQLIERKGPDLVIEALADPRLKGATLTIVGAGPLEHELRAMVRAFSLDTRVVFLGLRDTAEMAAHFASHHTLVMPSRAEVWGLVSNEALASGLHAVVSDRAGCAVDLAGHRGVFAAPPAVGQIANAMAASMAAWTGPIANPEILRHDATRMARDIRAAIALTRSERRAL